MKKFARCLGLALACAALCACSFTEDLVKDGVSFRDIKTFYVDEPIGGDIILSSLGDRSEFDAMMVSKIRASLEKEGYEWAPRDSAQMTVRPCLNTSVERDRSADGFHFNETISFGTRKISSYCMLEIQIYFPGREDWVWRGFGPDALYEGNLTEGAIANQVYWCMSEFPPEKHPTRLQRYFQSQEAEKAKEQADFKPAAGEANVNTAPAAAGSGATLPEPQKAVEVEGDAPKILP